MFPRQRNRSTRRPSYNAGAVCHDIPIDSIPTTIIGNRRRAEHTGVTTYIQRPSIPTSDWWGVVVACSLPITELITAIRQGTAIAVTDGSYKDELGTAAFTFKATEQDTRELSFVHMTPGMPHELSPYRTEVGGLFGIASLLSRIVHGFDCTGGKITIACDCKGALDRAFHTYPPAPKQPDFDLFSEIYRMRTTSPISWEKKWVKGHQDDNTLSHHLDTWARLNIAMDTLAKRHWTHLDRNRPRPFSLPPANGTWSIWQADQRLTKWDKATADQLYFNQKAREHWAQKYTNFPLLDYEAIRMAYKSTSLFYQLRVPKWIGRRLPVGSKMHQWSPHNPSECPRCGTTNEDHFHVITCQHPGAIAIVNKWLDQLDLWLATQHTPHPTLRSGITSLLRAGVQDTPWQPPYTPDRAIQRVFLRQQQQGHKNIMFGWWDHGWAEIQQMYFRNLSRRTTGKRWLATLIQKQWEVSWDMWKHRIEIDTTTDSFSLALAHERINTEIRRMYATLATSDHPPMRRWFSQPAQVVLNQTLTFKQDWLCMVQCLQIPNDPTM